MDEKDIIDATPDPDAPNTDTLNDSDQYAGPTDINYQYSLRNRKFAS